MKSIGAMIMQLSALTGSSDLNQWEHDFVVSVTTVTYDGVDTSRITEKQIAVVERIYRKHFGDSE